MNNKVIVWVVALIAAVVVGGVFLFRDGAGGVAGPEGAATSDDGVVAGDDTVVEDDSVIVEEAEVIAEVVYSSTGFSPSVVTIQSGQSVRFVNESGSNFWVASAIHPTHTLYGGTSLAEHCPNPSGAAFDACGGIAPGASWSFTFTKAGEWTYHDHLNPRSIGKVIVE